MPTSNSMILEAAFGDAWQFALERCIARGQVTKGVRSETSPGVWRDTITLPMPLVLGVTNVRARYLLSPVRPLRWGFPLGNFLYLLSGSKVMRDLEYYNARAMDFSDDGTTLHGTYGPRLTRQLQYVMNLLRWDPQTRRAVLGFYDPALDHIESKDIPCVLSMQLLYRDPMTLDAVVSMRSLNLFSVFPYDFMLFSMLQEYLAVQIGWDTGALYFLVNAPHVYRQDEAEILQATRSIRTGTLEMKSMTSLSSENLQSVLDMETRLRMNNPALPQLGVSEYWQGYLRCLDEYARLRWRTDATAYGPTGAGPMEALLGARVLNA